MNIDLFIIPEQTKILRIINRYADFGKISNKQLFHKVEGDIWEFKNFQVRILMYHSENRIIVLTHGFKKKKDKIPPKEIVRSNNIMEEYERVKGGWAND